jgi:uncharacterized membrane protein YhaH (DUF805 family)
MSSTNPFAPPVAHVSDINLLPDEVQPVRIFAVSGRVGRLRYFAWAVGTWFLLGALSAIVGPQVTAFMWVGLAAYFVLNVMFLIQRSHDMDLSGWFTILAFIPLVGLFWLFKGGTPGSNRWGAPPPPNTLGVKIVAWLIPAIMVIGILAAISLPAYSDYQKRAKAAQMK